MVNPISLSATPMLPDGMSPTEFATRQQQKSKAVRVASPDLIIEPQSLPVELMTDMTIDDMNTSELINIARHNLIKGTNVEYKPFANLSILNSKYDPLRILAISDGTPAQFDAYAISLQLYLPDITNVSVDSDKNIVIDFINVEDGDFIEVEIVSQGEVYNDTI